MLIKSTEAFRRLQEDLDLRHAELNTETADRIMEHATTLQAVDCLFVYVVDPGTGTLAAYAMPADLDRLSDEIEATESVVEEEAQALARQSVPSHPEE